MVAAEAETSVNADFGAFGSVSFHFDR
jgi:hypothetical protein